MKEAFRCGFYHGPGEHQTPNKTDYDRRESRGMEMQSGNCLILHRNGSSK